MKIAVDFREAAKPNRAGKGEYTFQLVKTWLNQATGDELILLIEPDQTVALPSGPWQSKIVPVQGWLWHFWVVAWLEFLRPVKLYFSPVSLIVPALVRSVKVVTTLHDFTVWRFPAQHLARAVVIERWLMPLALRASSHLIAVSEFTKQEAIDLFAVPASKVTVTLEAVGNQFHQLQPTQEEIDSTRTQYGLPAKFLLFLGTLEPRKNIARTIEAFNIVATEFPETKLVLAGGRGWQMDQLLATPNPNLVLTGYIADSDRAMLYHLATGLVFPSLYEGFGLPPVCRPYLKTNTGR